MKLALGGLGLAFALTTSGVALAQDDMGDDGAMAEDDAMPEDDAMADETTAEEAPAEEPVAEEAKDDGPVDGASSKDGGDGGRFRFGVAGGAGPLSIAGLGLTYFGVDMRFGWQINNAIGVYAVPQMGYYKLNGADALFGSGGLIGASVVVDYTLFDRLFLGAGLGYAILNNPSGLELHFRAGGYPLMGKSKTKVRRKGLMLGVDFRLHLVDGYTGVAPTFNLGYDAF